MPLHHDHPAPGHVTLRIFREEEDRVRLALGDEGVAECGITIRPGLDYVCLSVKAATLSERVIALGPVLWCTAKRAEPDGPESTSRFRWTLMFKRAEP